MGSWVVCRIVGNWRGWIGDCDGEISKGVADHPQASSEFVSSGFDSVSFLLRRPVKRHLFLVCHGRAGRVTWSRRQPLRALVGVGQCVRFRALDYLDIGLLG